MGYVLTLAFRLIAWVSFLAPFILAILAIEREPLVVREPQALDANAAKAVLERFDATKLVPGATTKITASADEITLAIGTVLSGDGPLAARVDVQDGDVAVRSTTALPIPETFLGRYLNIEATVAESDKELVVRQVKIGAIAIPGWIAKPVAVTTLDWLIGEGKAERAIESVRSVAVEKGVITVAISPPVP